MLRKHVREILKHLGNRVKEKKKKVTGAGWEKEWGKQGNKGKVNF